MEPWVPKPSKVHNLPKMKIPKSNEGPSHRANAGGIRSRVGGGTLKSGGFKGGSKASGSRGKVGPGTGFQGSHPKGTRRAGNTGPKITRKGFSEKR